MNWSVMKHWWSKKSTITWSIMVAGALGIGVVLARREPRYQDRRLSAWFEQLYQPARGLKQAQDAVHEIGPEAVPFLLQKLRDGDKIKDENNLLLRLHRAAWTKLPARLKRLFREPKSWDDSLPLRVRWALRQIGPAAVPALVPAFNDRVPDVRFVAISAMGLIDADPAITVPALTRLLRDRNPDVRVEAVRSVGLIAQNHGQAVSVLITALQDSNARISSCAAEALAALGPQASAALPQLTGLLRDGRSRTRQEAALALWHIKQDTNVQRVLTSELGAIQDDTMCVRILDAFGEMGTLAKPATPVIVTALTNRFRSSSAVTEHGLKALRKIDSNVAKVVAANFESEQLASKDAYLQKRNSELQTLLNGGPLPTNNTGQISPAIGELVVERKRVQLEADRVEAEKLRSQQVINSLPQPKPSQTNRLGTWWPWLTK